MIFFFHDRVFWVSYTCSSDYSVYDGEWCTYTHLMHAHFSAQSVCTITFTHLHACHKHAWLKCHEKGVCICVIPLHLALSSLMSHPSLLFCDGHFETILDFDVHTFLPNIPVLKKRRACASPHEDEQFGYLAKSALNTGYEPNKFDKITSVDNDTMLIDDPNLNEISDF